MLALDDSRMVRQADPTNVGQRHGPYIFDILGCVRPSVPPSCLPSGHAARAHGRDAHGQWKRLRLLGWTVASSRKL